MRAFLIPQTWSYLLIVRLVGLIIRDDPQTVGQYIANYICKRCAISRLCASGLSECLTRIHEFSPTPEKPFVLGLPTGSTPLPTYKALIAMVNEKTLSYVTLRLWLCQWRLSLSGFVVSKMLLPLIWTNTWAFLKITKSPFILSCSVNSFRKVGLRGDIFLPWS